MADTANHHFIPQFYLRSFASGLGRKARVNTFDLASGETFKTWVRNVGSKRHFNRVKIDGVDPNAYERAYSKLEAEAAPILGEVALARSFPSVSHFNYLMNLIAVLSVRHPRQRKNMHDSMVQLHEAMFEAVISSKERWEKVDADMRAKGYTPPTGVTYEELKAFHQSKEYDIEIEQTYFVQQEVELVTPVLECLGQRNWSFKIAPRGEEFVTSDYPAVLTWLDRPSKHWPPGHGLKGTMVYFPLSPEVAVVGTFEHSTSRQLFTALQVASANTLIAHHAHRQMYSQTQLPKFLDRSGIVNADVLLKNLRQVERTRPAQRT